MNARCPSCETLYRVDPAKVPAEGIRASCVTCGSVFLVTRRTSDEVLALTLPDAAEPASPTDTRQPQIPAVEAEIPEPPGAEEPAVTIGLPEALADTRLSDVAPDMPAVSESPESEPVSQSPAQPVEIDAAWTAIEPTPPVQPVDPQPEPTHIDGVPEADEPELTRASLEPTEPPKLAHFELETPPETPMVEPESVDEPAEPFKPRFSRPFIQPRTDSASEPESHHAAPMRPSAPVFRPTPGMPVRTPPIPDAPPKPATVAPIAPHIRPSVPSEPLPAVPKRPVNPFLSRDPNQKARRLARALVSDMIVYQPKKRQDALEAGTLKEAFEEEIKKSWDEYVQQVGEELADSNDFFTEALNDILAGGRQVF